MASRSTGALLQAELWAILHSNCLLGLYLGDTIDVGREMSIALLFFEWWAVECDVDA